MFCGMQKSKRRMYDWNLTPTIVEHSVNRISFGCISVAIMLHSASLPISSGYNKTNFIWMIGNNIV
jgi:hypothetical protein